MQEQEGEGKVRRASEKNEEALRNGEEGAEGAGNQSRAETSTLPELRGREEETPGCDENGVFRGFRRRSSGRKEVREGSGHPEARG